MTGNLKDSDVTNDGEPGGVFSLDIGGYDVLRLDAAKDVPGFPGIPGAISAGMKWADGDSDWSELFNIAGSVGDLAANAVVYAADPLNWLISAGLSFLIDVVQPLEDMLGLVTGNAERMEGEIAKWDRVAGALVPLAEEIRTATANGLLTWEGRTADAARTRLAEFADGVDGIANDVKKVVMVLNLAKLLMEALQALIIGVLATFIEWLVFTWVAAMAAAVPTAGASTAAAGAATGVQAGIATSRGTAILSRGVGILRQLRGVLTKLHPSTMRRVQTTFQPRIAGKFTSGWIGSGQALINSLADWRAWAGTIDKALVTGANEIKRGVDYSRADRLSDEEMDRSLDPDR